jgi:hypothetical protein
MTARAENLIAEVRAHHGIIRRDGDMIELAAPQPLPADLVVRLRAAKPAVLAALAESDWRARHREALEYWRAQHPSEEASELAWREMQNRWHRAHGKRWPILQCAGCDTQIGGRETLVLADGNHVHLDMLDCLICYGERWRSEADAGLRALGLAPPPAPPEAA